MIGVLNTTCEWCKKQGTNKYNETSYSSPSSLKCAIGQDTKLKQTDVGLVKTEEKYFILHDDCVSDGDKLDGFIVAVSAVKSHSGSVLYYKAVVLNA